MRPGSILPGAVAEQVSVSFLALLPRPALLDVYVK